MSVAGSGREGRRPSRRQHVRTTDLLILLILGVIIVVAFNVGFEQLFSLLYSPTAGLILLIVIVEFLWLKSGDRTRIYRLENDRLRTKLRQDEELLRQARELLGQATQPSDPPAAGTSPDWAQRAEKLKKDIDERV